MSTYVSLHNQTTYSLLDSLCSTKDLFKRAKELNQSAIAITDHGTLAASWEAYKAYKETGVKFIVGCEFYFVDNIQNIDVKFKHLVLIAKNAVGYKNILTLNKRAFEQGKISGNKVYPILDWTLLEKYTEGVICLTACGNGILSQSISNGKLDEAENNLLKLKSLFNDNLAVEVQANNMKRNANAFSSEIDQKFLNKQLITLAQKHNVKVVPTSNTHYIDKSEYKTHDVLLAIGSKQSVYSNFRLKYPVNDFYLKSEEEIFNFFSRNYSKEFTQEIINNTKYFADLCENPDWVDPKYTNDSGKELPVFPVKDEPDYNEFHSWLLNQNEYIKNLSEDKSYLRFKVEKSFQQKIINDKISEDQIQTYKDRIAKELDVFEKLDISSYMLITADFLNYARKNNISVGSGRGCVKGETQVLTENGFKQLKDIKVGDGVYTHTGVIKKVFNKFKYDVSNEELLSLKLENSFGNLVLTNDHKIYACKNKKEKNIKYYSYKYNKNHKYKGERNVFSDPEWIEAKNLNVGDYVYTLFPENTNKKLNVIFDLSKFVDDNCKFNENEIFLKKNINSKFSIRSIQKETGLGFELLRSYKNNINTTNINKDILIKYLDKNNISFDEWVALPKWKEYSIPRYIKLDDEFLYILGRWVGDGSIRHKNRGINIAFHKNEINDIKRIRSFFEKLNFSVYQKKDKDNSNASGLDIGNYILSNLFRSIFNDYKSSSKTKCLPNFFRKLDNEQLICLLKGIIDSDGSICKKTNRENITTTSKCLILQIKECLNLLKIASGVCHKKANTHLGRNNADSYVIGFYGIINDKLNKHYYNNGYYSKITYINKVKENFVYDITVDDDHSYLTSSGIVHNSAGGSYIAYLLNIHCADSIKYGLIFERFHNMLKKSMSDIDNDITSFGREYVINYVRRKYGNDNVASISNFNRITPKVYIRDISRALELGGSKESAVKLGNDISGIVPADVKSVDSAYEGIPLFSEYCKKYPELINFKKINNQIRAASKHAAGIVIGARSLTGLVPLRHDKDNDVVLEYEKETTEENGLVKIDILGLKTLDVIDLTYKLIKQSGKEIPNINFEDNDIKTYNLISSGKCEFVFQFGGSPGTMDLCKKVKPNNIEDLALITTIARPSSKEIREDVIKTKHGKKPITFLHKKLENSLKSTFGYALYDESLLQIANDVAGWDLAKADGLRKLTKLKGSKPKLALELQKSFIEGAIKNGLTKPEGELIWDNVIINFEKYSFNKSHAILYSIISYQTAYLKAHYPVEFLLANLMFEVKSNTPTAKLNIEKAKKELREHKVKILPPNINTSELAYKLIDDKTLLTGLDALRNVGDDAIKDILSKRPFKSFQDFMSRVSSRHVRSSTIQALAASGALDCFNISRKKMFLYNSDYRKKLTAWKKKHNSETEDFNYPWEEAKDWDITEYYALEVHYLNEGFICKPHDAYNNFFNDPHKLYSDIKKSDNRQTLLPIKAVIIDCFSFKVKKEGSKFLGKTMAKLLLEDKNNEKYSCTIFPDKWEIFTERLKKQKIKEIEPGLAISFSGQANIFEEEVGIILNDVFDIKNKPQMPEDRKQKKVSLRSKEKSEAISDILNTNVDDPLFEEQIKDYLYDENLIDIDDE